MPRLSPILIACAIIGLGIVSGRADDCSDKIAQLEALVDPSMRNPAPKPMLSQSTDAQLHHQPTAQSVRQAEEHARSRFAAALARAKTLNAEGNAAECIESVGEAKRFISID